MAVIIFIIILVILVLVHEFGHFTAAKLFGVKVEEFGVGFPPRLLGVKKGETMYSVNLLPLGGFVRIFGEEGQGRDDKRSYASRPAWVRATILVAGVALNLVFAFLLYWVGFTIGYPTVINEQTKDTHITNTHIQILDIGKDSPALRAGLKQGDVITQVSLPDLSQTKPIVSVSELQVFARQHRGQTIRLSIERGQTVLNKDILVRPNPPADQGPMGIALAEVGLIKFPWYEAFGKAFVATYTTALSILFGLALLLKSLLGNGQLISQVSGPVGIATMTGQFYELGFNYLLGFIAAISVNLAVINVLPIPALDGGRLFFIMLEKLKGSPIKRELENKVNAIGFALMLALLVLVTIKDILQL